jgi:hypothetical protein
MILSASRRTDIPAFYFPWFLERMRAGFVDVPNPFNARQVRRVSLLPGDVDVVVFWTKDARPMKKHLAAFEACGIPWLILYTLTPYGGDIEPGLFRKEGIPDSFRELAGRIGPERILWRYDPIILTPELTPDRHIAAFEALAGKLEGRVRRCITSFAVPYRQARKNFDALRWYAPDAAVKGGLLGALAGIAASRGMRLQTCADEDSPREEGLSPPQESARTGPLAGACIDTGLISRILGKPVNPGKDKNQRPACLCAQSVDIGRYGTCGHGCVYCYAGSARPIREKD